MYGFGFSTNLDDGSDCCQACSDTARLQQQDSWQLDQDWDFIMEECYDAQEEIDAAEHLEMQELEGAHRHDLAEERELAASSAEGNKRGQEQFNHGIVQSTGRAGTATTQQTAATGSDRNREIGTRARETPTQIACNAPYP